MSQIELVNRESHLAEVVSRATRARNVAIDLESNGFFRYHERVCLVQLAIRDTAYLIDPLAIHDVRPLGELLGDGSVEKVFHAADYDLRLLDKDWGFSVNNVFDTSVAASFAGSVRLGLQSVVEEHVGVQLWKPPKLQRSDWTVRPLKLEALMYAANDVLHLTEAREALTKRLECMSRLSWVAEEFARLENARFAPSDPETAFLSVKGSGGLHGRGLAVLRSLHQLREREAKRIDRPPFRVISDSTLIALASDPGADLSSVKGLGRFGRPPAVRDLRAAIVRGLDAEPVSRTEPHCRERETDPQENGKMRVRLGTLKAWRKNLGEELNLEPGLLWPAASLNRLAENPSSLEAEYANPEVRSWQMSEFGASLAAVLKTLN